MGSAPAPVLSSPPGLDRAAAVRGVADDTTDTAAFEQLCTGYRRRLAGLVRRRLTDADLADDIVQETLLRAYRARLHRERSGEEWRWLATVARNLCIDAARAQGPSRECHLDGDAADAWAVDRLAVGRVDGAFPDPERELLASGRREGVVAVLEQLPPKQRRLLLGFYGEGRSYRELAVKESVSVDAVRALLARARRGFRERYAALAERAGLAGVPALPGVRGRMERLLRRATRGRDDLWTEAGPLACLHVPAAAQAGLATVAAVVAAVSTVALGVGLGLGPDRVAVPDPAAAAGPTLVADTVTHPPREQGVILALAERPRTGPDGSEEAVASPTATPPAAPSPGVVPDPPSPPGADSPPPEPLPIGLGPGSVPQGVSPEVPPIPEASAPSISGPQAPPSPPVPERAVVGSRVAGSALLVRSAPVPKVLAVTALEAGSEV